MEPSPPSTIARKLLNYVRIVFFMLRKGVSKRKLMMELHLVMKRGKIAGKAIGHLMFHPHSNSSSRSQDPNLSFVPPAGEYEFSCSSSPAYPSSSSSFFPFHLSKRKTSQPHHSHSHHYFSCMHPTATDDDITAVNAVQKALEMLNVQDMTEASPIPSSLPGFGRSPMVRQLRITDSPFPLTNTDEDSHVDKAAEEFIQMFYKNLKLQNMMAEIKA